MRVVAAVASLAVAFAAGALPASFVTIRGDADATMQTQDEGERDHDGVPGEDAGTESDDDRDELDAMDELVAVFAATHPTFVPQASETTWCFHAPRSPRAPHPEDTLRPPIAI